MQIPYRILIENELVGDAQVLKKELLIFKVNFRRLLIWLIGDT